MARYFVFVFWVYDAAGGVVTHYAQKALAVGHAKRIGGTWRKGRL